MTAFGRIERAVRIALSILLVLPSALAPATITVQGSCSLSHAIRAANRDTRVGACPPGAGADTIRLTADIELTTPDSRDNGLPPVDSTITIDGRGFAIERASSAPAFRILDVSPNGDLTLEDVTIAGGSVSARGGGIHTRGILALTNSTVTGNESRNRGGGIYARGVDEAVEVTLVNSIVSKNTARRGGGITAYEYVNLAISGSTISENVADSRGGGLLLNDTYRTTTISNSTIAGNSAASGGGIRASFYTYLEITDTVISNNTSTRFEGGGIFASYSGVDLVRSLVTGNSASRGGGLFAAPGYSEVRLRDSTLSANTATGAGGGLFFSGYPDARLRLTNTTVSGNTAESGGGLYLYSTYYRDSSRISHSSISQNTASQGAGVHAMTSYAEYHILSDSLVAGNDGDNCAGPGLSGEGANFDDDGSCPGAEAITPGTDFEVDLADNGGATPTHALLEGSVAIDAAGNCSLATDQRGFRRDALCDSGSFEFAAVEPVGAAVIGVANRKIFCKNTTTGQKGRRPSTMSSWLCSDLGVQTSPGDRVRLSSTGIADGTGPVGGSVTGLTEKPKRRVTCRNRTTRKKVSFVLDEPAWDCEARGLAFEPGDRVLQKIKGGV
ncbi:MAG: choice-of-anchor Q domain-containing protein [Thermoanaerobaculia bacterium]